MLDATVRLNGAVDDGLAMPRLGFGVWQVPPDVVKESVSTALSVGYRSIDTAAVYGNESGTGEAIRDSGVPREEIFLTTKLWNNRHGDLAPGAFERSLDRLGVDYLDLYLIHWPCPAADDYVATWEQLLELQRGDQVRAVGVSNFTIEHLQRLIAETGMVPAVNQVELHPWFPQAELRAFHAEHGIATEAWSPLGQGQGLLDDPNLVSTAERLGRTPAQVVLRWHLEIGNVVIPKSVTASRIAENFAVFDFELDDTARSTIAGMDRKERIGPDPAGFNLDSPAAEPA